MFWSFSGIGRFESKHFGVRNCLGMTKWGFPCFDSCVSLPWARGRKEWFSGAEGMFGDFSPGLPFWNACVSLTCTTGDGRANYSRTVNLSHFFSLCFFSFYSAQEVTSWFWGTLLFPRSLGFSQMHWTLSESFFGFWPPVSRNCLRLKPIRPTLFKGDFQRDLC